METTYLNFNGFEIPTYLGYGILNEKSIRYENETLYADYVFECDQSVVHKIVWDNKQCLLDTYCQGVSGNKTSYPNLKHSLLCECPVWRLDKDACFLFLSKQVSGLGNIYVNHLGPDKEAKSINYYPAANIFLFTADVS